jgi:putative hemolysin
MHTNLKDTLDGIEYSVTILTQQTDTHAGSGGNAAGEIVLRGCESGYCGQVSAPKITLCYVEVLEVNGHGDSAVATWPDEVLERVADGEGVLILNADSGGYKLSKLFSPDEVARLRFTENVGVMLYAHFMMTTDVTQPLLESELVVNERDSGLDASDEVIEEVKMLDAGHCLHRSDGLALYLFKGREIPAFMQLIGRARAVTFSAIGAGSGQEVDVSAEDEYYDHLALWDINNQSFIGAYRLGFTEEIIKTHGPEGLYLNHIFNFDKEYYEKIGSAMELSRSFVLPAYQKNPKMLDTLWKGIGLAAVAKNCYTLYGSVTISASFTPLSQAILVDTLDRYHSEAPELRAHVKARSPFNAQTNHHSVASDAWSKRGLKKLNNLVQDLENDHRSIPPLIRYYAGLGAKYLSFQVEESFNDAIYCLLKVDLKSLPRRYRKRFLGE